MKEAKYTIYSAPVSIGYTCPHCGEYIEVKVKDIDMDIWVGGIVECPECHEDVVLEQWEYD